MPFCNRNGTQLTFISQLSFCSMPCCYTSNAEEKKVRTDSQDSFIETSQRKKKNPPNWIKNKQSCTPMMYWGKQREHGEHDSAPAHRQLLNVHYTQGTCSL